MGQRTWEELEAVVGGLGLAMPANDERGRDIIRFGRDKMPGYSQELTPEQIDDLLAYLHTL